MTKVINMVPLPINLKTKTCKDLPRKYVVVVMYGSWIYNYLCNHCLSPLTLYVRIPLRRGVLDTTLCDKVCQ